jgi:uncharacterized protein YqgC (DUF456 family)
MVYVWGGLLVILNVFWLALVLPGLPGIWLMAASAALLGWFMRDAYGGAGMFSLVTLGAVVVLAAIAEVLEFVAGIAGSNRAAGTRWGAVGALVGSVIGAIAATPLIPIPVIGALIGACFGACLGALVLELATGRQLPVSLKVGIGAGIGRFMGTMLKLGIGVVAWFVLAIAAFWP